MKKILDFIKKYWKWVSIGLCGLLIFITFTCSNANYKQTQKLLFQTELQNATQTLRDSITDANNKQLIILQDSIQKIEKAKSDAAKKKADQWESKANGLNKQNQGLQKKVKDLLTQYGDSLDAGCIEVVNAYQNQVEGLIDENYALGEAVNELDLVVTADSIGWGSCNKENLIKDQTIKSKVDLLKVREDLNNDLKKQLTKQNNWFNKNKGWIGLGTGIVLGILITK